MFGKPISTIEHAREFFVAMGSSGFHMSREYPERYDEYKKLNIPKDLEIEWRQQQVDVLLTEMMMTEDYSTLWMTHSSMAELVGQLRTPDFLGKILQATEYIRDKVPLEDRVMASETINGRQDRRYRSGLIYLSYDLQNPSVAKEFAVLSIHFAVYVEGQTIDLERCQRANQTCNDIVAELGL